MAFLMKAMALQFNEEGLALQKKEEYFVADEYLDPQPLFFNPRYVTDIGPHPGKPGRCFMTMAGDQYTILESADSLVARLEEFMSTKSMFN